MSSKETVSDLIRALQGRNPDDEVEYMIVLPGPGWVAIHVENQSAPMLKVLKLFEEK